MHLLSDLYIRIVINDHSYNVHISLVHIKSWCHMLFNFINLVVDGFDFFFLLWFFIIWGHVVGVTVADINVVSVKDFS